MKRDPTFIMFILTMLPVKKHTTYIGTPVLTTNKAVTNLIKWTFTCNSIGEIYLNQGGTYEY